MQQYTRDQSESQGCTAIVIGFILVAIYCMRVIMGSLVPSATILWNARDYRPASFLVQRTTYIPAQQQGKLRLPATWMALARLAVPWLVLLAVGSLWTRYKKPPA